MNITKQVLIFEYKHLSNKEADIHVCKANRETVIAIMLNAPASKRKGNELDSIITV